MTDAAFFADIRPVEYGEERFIWYDRYCVDYDGHWAGADRQVWTYKSYFTNSLEDALRWYEKSPAPKKIRQRLSGKYWCSVNLDKLRKPEHREWVQQEFNFEYD